MKTVVLALALCLGGLVGFLVGRTSTSKRFTHLNGLLMFDEKLHHACTAGAIPSDGLPLCSEKEQAALDAANAKAEAR